MTSGESREGELAGRVSADADLIDVRLRRISAELHRPTSDGPLTLELEVKPSVSRVDGLVVYNLAYAFQSKDQSDGLVLDGHVELSVVYALRSPEGPADEQLAAFGRDGVLLVSHPYLRELLHNLTGRMGLPPLLLSVLRQSQEDRSG